MRKKDNRYKNLADQLVVEEFSQIHEHIRKREESMNQLLSLTVTGSITLLTGIATFVFQLAVKDPDKLTITFCYLLLTPIPFLFFALSMLSSHRDDIYRMGYYLRIFYTKRIGGILWGTSLGHFRKKIKGESQDPAMLAIWSIFIVSSVLFCIGLNFLGKAELLHLLILIPILLIMILLHHRFRKDRSDIEKAWLSVKDEIMKATDQD